MWSSLPRPTNPGLGVEPALKLEELRKGWPCKGPLLNGTLVLFAHIKRTQWLICGTLTPIPYFKYNILTPNKMGAYPVWELTFFLFSRGHTLSYLYQWATNSLPKVSNQLETWVFFSHICLHLSQLHQNLDSAHILALRSTFFCSHTTSLSLNNWISIVSLAWLVKRDLDEE